VLEAVLIPFFALKWFPQVPKQAFLVLVLQIALLITVCAPVFIFNW
jgi:hypothetical protein